MDTLPERLDWLWFLDYDLDYEKKNNRYISSTDPDAAIVNRGKPKLSYQVHRTVEGQNELETKETD